MEKPALTQVTAGCKPLTTFVQTDTNSFREVVQTLTGPSEPNSGAQAQQDVYTTDNNKIMGLKRPKLQERRQYMKPKLEIVKPNLHFRPAWSPTYQSGPSRLLSPQGTPSTIMSKLNIGEEKKNEKSEGVLNSKEEEKAIKERRFYLHPSPRGRPGTPSTIMSKLNIGEEKKNEKSEGVLNSKEEEKAIKERRFYLHPSPRGRPGYSEPELLALFPLTSPGPTEKENTHHLDK